MATTDTHIGFHTVWGGQQPLVLSRGDRRRHVYIVGQTGTGKSTLFCNLLAQDIASGAGCALIDPHGDLAHAVLASVPRHRVDDVVVLDPSDVNRPVSVNPFYRVPKDERPLAAANITGIFEHIWDLGTHTPRLVYILRNVIAALLDAPDELRPTFISIPRVLVHAEYRRRVVASIEDSEVRRFFIDEYERWNERQRAEYIGSVQNKIGEFLANPFVRNIIGQWKPTIDFYDIMQSNKILIVRLAKGTLGEVPMKLLGSFVVSGLQQGALRRASLPEAERTDFHLHIDEFQNFTTSAATFESLLSEARKYGLTLTAGHQYLDQVPESVQAAVFGNVGTFIAFRVGPDDAVRLAKQIGEDYSRILVEQSRGEICGRITKDVEAGQAFMGMTIPQAYTRHGHTKNILHQSRMRYGIDRQRVEKDRARWLQSG